MINGLGFFEVMVIGALVLVFFGSRELPRFLRETGRLLGQMRRYSDRVRRELNEAARSMEAVSDLSASVGEQKKALRASCMAACKALTPQERDGKSEAIRHHVTDMEEYRRARAVMIYVSAGSEVQTCGLMKDMLAAGKRVIVPYVRSYGNDLGIAEIANLEKDLEKGAYGIFEPVKALRDNFFKSDLQLVICPGVGFDATGSRLGRGKACYDNFLRELRGKVPIIGLAFDCQILKEPIPFDYHDVSVDQVITESGPLIKRNGGEGAAARVPAG